ncbi:MAG: MFS transporter [SAR202 cluster bacterium Io17-Chloro-G9]|nr:MAG: MFS transporter [SAR202 cluster bacterium Io17-Chloro-G9]
MAELQTQVASTHHQHGVRRTGPFILGGITSGHGVFHWFTQSFLVMLPEVRETFALAEWQVGSITSVREIASGLVALPGGVATDLLRRHWGLVLACCMAAFGIGWLLMGLAPVFFVLLVGMGVVAVAASLWHLPGVAALSHHFSHRRGSALSFHGVGGQIGDAAAPVVTGLLLAVLTWQQILEIYAAVPIFLTFLVFWAFRDIGKIGDGEDDTKPNLTSQLDQTTMLFRQPRIWGIVLVAGLRGMAFISFLTFLPLYLNDEAGLGTVSRGLHMSLLVLVGIISTPVMGYLSDRLGRKQVLIPGMIWLAVLTALMAPFGHGVLLVVLLGLLGTFVFSDQPILTAAALDIVGEGPAATTLGVLSFSRFGMAAASPLIGGFLYGVAPYLTFYYIAGLFALATVILLVVPLQPLGLGAGVHAGHGHHDGDGSHPAH